MFERMSAGEWYGEKPDAELSRAFWRAKDLAWEFNQTRPSNRDHGAEILTSLFGHLGKHSTVLGSRAESWCHGWPDVRSGRRLES